VCSFCFVCLFILFSLFLSLRLSCYHYYDIIMMVNKASYISNNITFSHLDAVFRNVMDRKTEMMHILPISCFYIALSRSEKCRLNTNTEVKLLYIMWPYNYLDFSEWVGEESNISISVNDCEVCCQSFQYHLSSDVHLT